MKRLAMRRFVVMVDEEDWRSLTFLSLRSGISRSEMARFMMRKGILLVMSCGYEPWKYWREKDRVGAEGELDVPA